jgi:hypothetical protein
VVLGPLFWVGPGPWALHHAKIPTLLPLHPTLLSLVSPQKDPLMLSTQEKLVQPGHIYRNNPKVIPTFHACTLPLQM